MKRYAARVVKRRGIALVTMIGFGLVACAQIIGLSKLEEGDALPEAGGDGPIGSDGGDSAVDGDAQPIDTCSNGQLDPGETDVDCGGSTCGKCVKGKKCKVDGDCAKTCGDAGVCVGCEGIDIDAGGACVDSLEVTVAEYAEFAKARATNVRDRCPTGYNHPVDFASQQADPKLPVRNVEWCAALAFCRFRGKRLCGRFDGVRTVDPAAFADVAVDQWMAACSGSGAQAYPYADTFDPARCNDQSPAGGPWQAGSGVDCKTVGFAIFDMSGNVAEWEDSCIDAGARDVRCRVRGGSFASSDVEVACAADALQDINTPSARIGFRCCE